MQARGTDRRARGGLKLRIQTHRTVSGGIENERNEKVPVEQKAGDPLGGRTIASPPQRRRFEQQLAASHGRCIAHERGNLAQRKTIAHRLGFRSTTRMASNKLTDSPSRLDIAMRSGLRPAMRAS